MSERPINDELESMRQYYLHVPASEVSSEVGPSLAIKEMNQLLVPFELGLTSTGTFYATRGIDMLLHSQYTGVFSKGRLDHLQVKVDDPNKDSGMFWVLYMDLEEQRESNLIYPGKTLFTQLDLTRKNLEMIKNNWISYDHLIHPRIGSSSQYDLSRLNPSIRRHVDLRMNSLAKLSSIRDISSEMDINASTVSEVSFGHMNGIGEKKSILNSRVYKVTKDILQSLPFVKYEG